MAYVTQKPLNADIAGKVRQYAAKFSNNGIAVERVYIFGSHAKHSARGDSDIDVAVVSPAFGRDTVAETQMLFKQRRSIDTRIEPYPLSPAEFDDILSPLASEVKKHGILVS